MSEATLLIVEHNIPLLEGIRELLEFSGYDVLAAENGREALSPKYSIDKPDPFFPPAGAMTIGKKPIRIVFLSIA